MTTVFGALCYLRARLSETRKGTTTLARRNAKAATDGLLGLVKQQDSTLLLTTRLKCKNLDPDRNKFY